MRRRTAVTVASSLLWAGLTAAQPASRPAEIQELIRVDAPLVALTHVRVVDGTGAPPRDDQTLVLRDGIVAAMGDASVVAVPADATVLDLTGRTVLPGLVMLHEHMFYPSGRGSYNELGVSFPRLYLAGGATTIRTGGSLEPYADLNLRRAIEAGERLGPDMDVTAPYLEGPGLGLYQVKALRGPDDARRMVAYWADEGATSFKAYTHISRAELKAAIDEAHGRGLKITGHLCSVTFREAAELGIDNLEHGFMASTDFVDGKKPDECPSRDEVRGSLLGLEAEGEEAGALIDVLVDRSVAITSTLPVFETLVPGRPPAPDRVLEAMVPAARDQYLRRRARLAVERDSPWSILYEKELALERRFVEAGGLLVAGTDPTGYGGVVAGFSNQRAVALLVEGGFTPLEAIRIATWNGARYLGREDRIGSIETGKDADLVVVDGDPSRDIADLENVELVFKKGVGYDSRKIFASVRGEVGLR